jgi:hypothetical protein
MVLNVLHAKRSGIFLFCMCNFVQNEEIDGDRIFWCEGALSGGKCCRHTCIFGEFVTESLFS